MQYDQFINTVQHRARLGTREQAVAAIRATLETLAERLPAGERKDLLSQLPRELAYYMSRAVTDPGLTLEQFYERVSMREPSELPAAIFHTKVVFSVLEEAVTGGEMSDVISQLPSSYAPLFEDRAFLSEHATAGVGSS